MEDVKNEQEKTIFARFPYCRLVSRGQRLLDYAYSDEGHMFYNFGTEGVSYTMVDDYPTYTEEVTSNPDGLSMQDAMSKYCRCGILPAPANRSVRMTRPPPQLLYRGF